MNFIPETTHNYFSANLFGSPLTRNILKPFWTECIRTDKIINFVSILWNWQFYTSNLFLKRFLKLGRSIFNACRVKAMKILCCWICSIPFSLCQKSHLPSSFNSIYTRVYALCRNNAHFNLFFTPSFSLWNEAETRTDPEGIVGHVPPPQELQF